MFFFNIEFLKQKKNLTVIIASAVIFIIIAGVLFATGVLNFGSIKNIFKKIPDDADLMSSRNAFDIGLLEARKWQEDAKLSYMHSGNVGQTGRSEFWRLIYVSAGKKGKGYLVEIDNFKVLSTTEIDYVGLSADLPENMISAEEVMRKVRQIKGYENEKILEMEVQYAGTKKKQWFWGVTTTKGTISIEAGN